MSEHLETSFLNALVSGELSEEERAKARKHLAECSSCTAGAFSSAMLKLATAKAGSVRLLARVRCSSAVRSPSNRAISK